jgi:hypothetical protein
MIPRNFLHCQQLPQNAPRHSDLRGVIALHLSQDTFLVSDPCVAFPDVAFGLFQRRLGHA